MKVAISSTGSSPDAKMDSHLGRCSYFVIYDTETAATEYIPNMYKENIEGCGSLSVQFVASKGVKKIVSGEFGAKVKAVSDSFQIQLIVLKGQEKTINEIIQMLNHSKG